MATEINDFAVELNNYVCQRYGYKKNACHVTRWRTIDVNRVKIQLYLRFKQDHFFKVNSLIVARIEFGKTRKGEGTALLKFFTELAAKYNIEHIAFEQVFTDGCKNFTEKLGFETIRDDKNWTITVDTLKNNLIALAR